MSDERTNKDPNECGAFWQKQGKKGVFLSGTVNGVSVIAFPITGGGVGTPTPSWRVLKSDPPRPKHYAEEPPRDPGPDDPFA
jgi:hypothetical protein